MKLNWETIDIPWVESNEYIDVVIAKSDMLTVLDTCEMEYSPASSGNFSYKMKCPFAWHADGMERTPSFYISSDKNNFYCFGCNFSGNAVDFVQYYLGKPYDLALDWLAALFDISKENAGSIDIKKRAKRNQEETIDFYAMKCSTILREWLISVKASDNYDKYCAWADKQYEQIDAILGLDDGDWQKARDKFDYLNNKLNKHIVG